MRLFIALEPPSELQQRIAELIEPLKRAGAAVKWVPAEQLHFTLKFLGEVEERRLAELKERLTGALKGMRAFPVHMHGLGYFGTEKFLRVIWLGVAEGRAELLTLVARMNQEFADIRKEEFEPTAHLTIGRVKGPQNRGALLEALRKLQELDAGSFAASEVLLKKSTLMPKGPIYENVAAVALEGI